MTILITGGAGFIGSNLASYFVNNNKNVIVFDNLSNSSRRNISKLFELDNFTFKNVDLSNYQSFEDAIESLNINIDEIWHLAANSDIKSGSDNMDIDFRDTFQTTFNSLKICKKFSIRKFFFASSSAIYGDFGESVIHEEIAPLLPISNYGAMKLASEALISSACETYLDIAYIFRFPNVIGIPATHGVILDLLLKLKKDKSKLHVLGNGFQKKHFMHVNDLISAMIFISKHSDQKINIYNIAQADEGVFIKDIVTFLIDHLGINVEIFYEKELKGWDGDVPVVNYSSLKLQKLGWTSSLNSEQSVKVAISEIVNQESTHDYN